MLNKKQKALTELESIIDDNRIYSHRTIVDILSKALAESARGTAHNYEALRLLSLLLPEEYKDEFERLK